MDVGRIEFGDKDARPDRGVVLLPGEYEKAKAYMDEVDERLERRRVEGLETDDDCCAERDRYRDSLGQIDDDLLDELWRELEAAMYGPIQETRRWCHICGGHITGRFERFSSWVYHKECYHNTDKPPF